MFWRDTMEQFLHTARHHLAKHTPWRYGWCLKLIDDRFLTKCILTSHHYIKFIGSLFAGESSWHRFNGHHPQDSARYLQLHLFHGRKPGVSYQSKYLEMASFCCVPLPVLQFSVTELLSHDTISDAGGWACHLLLLHHISSLTLHHVCWSLLAWW